MQNLFDWMLNIPVVVAQFGNWLNEPLGPIPLTPLELLGIAGVGTIISIIVIHIVKLFL